MLYNLRFCCFLLSLHSNHTHTYPHSVSSSKNFQSSSTSTEDHIHSNGKAHGSSRGREEKRPLESRKIGYKRVGKDSFSATTFNHFQDAPHYKMLFSHLKSFTHNKQNKNSYTTALQQQQSAKPCSCRCWVRLTF